MSDISDLRSTIVPKSDQLNAEQLLGGDMTITLTDVRMGSEDQPVILHYLNDEGRPYKPCKTMRKLLIFAWGEDGRDWVGKSMTLYNDQAVRFGGMTVGGIRISHLSHIERDIAISLTATKGKKAQHTVGVLKVTTLEDVLGAIGTATNKAGMDLAKKLAGQLQAPADVDKARAAYGAKAAELKARAKGQAPAALTFDQVRQKVLACKTPKEAQAALEQAKHLTEDEQNELRATAADLPY